MQVNNVIEGDCLEVMKTMSDNCIDTILTDPPYGLQFMGKNWDHGIPGPVYWREALRVAKPGSILMAFGGTRTYHRLACAIEDAGWEIRDCISYFNDGNQAKMSFMASLNDEQLAAYLELHYPSHQMAWVYGSGIGLGHNVSKAIDKSKGAVRDVVGVNTTSRLGHYNVFNDDGWNKVGTQKSPITAPATPLAAKFDGWLSRLKPAFEPIIVAMKPLDGTYAENAERWGVAGLWIDGGRIETDEESLQRPQRNGIGNVGGWHNYSQPKGLYGTPNGTGRYPANVILSGEPGVEAEFAKAGVSVSSDRPRKREIMTSKGVKGGAYGNPLKTTHNGYNGFTGGFSDSGSASRYFAHCPPDPNCLTCTDCITEDEPKGRYPANVIVDGSETVEAEFTKAGVRTSGKVLPHHKSHGLSTEGSHNGWKRKSHTQVGGFETYGDSGSASRYFAHCPSDTEPARFHYCPKAPPSERATPGNNHPTQKPLSLMRYLARLTKTPDGGIVLDPFAGSGTTALACISEGRDYIIIEKEPDYAALCRRRIAEYTGAEIAPKEVKVKEETIRQLGLW